MHDVRLGLRDGKRSQPDAHLAQFFRRVAVAGEFLPLLFAREARRAVGLRGVVLRQYDVSRSQHGNILTDDGAQGEAKHGEPLGQFLGRPVEINVLFEPVKGDFHFVLKIKWDCGLPTFLKLSFQSLTIWRVLNLGQHARL